MTPEQRRQVSELSQTLSQLQDALAEHVRSLEAQIHSMCASGIIVNKDAAVASYLVAKEQFKEAIESTRALINSIVAKQ